MPATVPNDFFREQRHFAEVKQELLVRYFEVWCSRQLATRPAGSEDTLLFVDLNVAAEQDLQAQQATAVTILQNLIRNAGKRNGLPEALQLYFGDPAKSKMAGLTQELEQLPAYETLAEKLAFLYEPGKRALLWEMLSGGSPALLFMDPFSYGYAQEMLLKACNTCRADLFLLLNPDSLRKTATGKKVSLPLSELLGERLHRISAFCRKEKDNGRREEYILQHLQSLLREKGFFTLLFRINTPDTDKASHYLLFASPHTAAYHSFKQLLLPYTEYLPDGVPLFVANQGPQHQLSLFGHRPTYAVAQLADALAGSAAQCKFKAVEKIYEMHGLNTPYILDNYLAAFEQLRDQGKVELLNGKTLQTVRKATHTSVVKYIPQPQAG